MSGASGSGNNNANDTDSSLSASEDGELNDQYTRDDLVVDLTDKTKFADDTVRLFSKWKLIFQHIL